MLDPQPPSDSLNGNNSNPGVETPLDDTDPGVHPDAARKVSGFGDLLALILAIPGGLRRGWAWANNTPDRRRVNTAFAFLMLVALAAVSMRGGKDVTPPTPQVVAAGPNTGIAAYGDSWITIAKANNIADWHDLVVANPELVDQNEAWCQARRIKGQPLSYNYRHGLRKDGQRRDDDLCVLYPYKGGEAAITTLLKGQRYNLPQVSTTAVADNVP